MRRIRRRAGRTALNIFCVLVAFILAAPMFIVVPLSFTDEKAFKFPPDHWSTRWYENLIHDPEWHRSLITSLEIAFVVTMLAVLLGTAAALALVRGRAPGKTVLSAVVFAPMMVPVMMIAVGVYAVFLEWHLAGTFRGFVLAHTALAVPFVVVTVSASLRTFDRRLEAAAASLGARPIKTFTRITLPLILPGILGGALFAFVTSFDELVVAIFLVGPDLQTLPVQMFTSVFEESDPTVAAASSVILGATTLMLLSALLFRVRGGFK